MSVAPAQTDFYVVLYGIPWSVYEKLVDEVFPEHYLRHTYDRGTLELRRLIHSVPWETYQAFLEATQDISIRHTYDQGTLEIMSPRKDHDWIKGVIGRLIEIVAFEFDIDIQTVGSTTITGEAIERGFQADEAYYVANEAKVRGKTVYEPNVDPPPDLVVEIDVTNSSLSRLPSFAAIGVPEVWRHDGDEVRFYRLSDEGTYEEIENSIAFPFIASDVVNRNLMRLADLRENEVVREFLEEIKKGRPQNGK